MTDDDLREIATAHGLTLYRRAGGERGWHDMREGALLAFARAAAAGGRTALLDYSADYLARLPEGQHGEADEAVQQLLRGLTD